MRSKSFPSVVLVLVFGILAFACPTSWHPAGSNSVCWAGDSDAKIEILSSVPVHRKRVCLWDLCNPEGISQEWKTLLSSIDLGDAPSPGTEKYIESAQLKAFIHRTLSSRGKDPSRLELSIPDRIIIQRESMQVSREQIESIYRDFVLSRVSWNPMDVVIRGINYSGSVDLPAGELSYEVTCHPQERFMGNVGVTIQFFVNKEKDRSLRVTGKVDVFQEVVHALRPIKRNEIISAGDLELQKMNISETPDRFATGINQVVGKRVLRDLGYRQAIPLADLDNPLALKRGASVTMLYDQPGLRLTAKGQVREDAGVGDTVRVVNVMTNRTVVCQVVDSTTVRVIP